MSNLNNDLTRKKIDKIDFKKRKRCNELNKFLNANFKYFIVVLILLIFWASFRFIIQPKFISAVIVTNEILAERQAKFIEKYQELEYHKRVLNEYSNIKSSDLSKINKMIPAEYSRGDLFVGLTHFLTSNNFKVEKIDVKSSFSSEVASSRRADPETIVENPYQKHISSLPTNISYWIAEIELSSISYQNLKYLLDILENNLRLLDVVSIDFQPEDKTVKIGLLTYYYKNN